MPECKFCHCIDCAKLKKKPICGKCGGQITERFFEYKYPDGNLCPLCAAKTSDTIPIPQHVAVFLMRYGLLNPNAEIACKDYDPYDGDYVGLDNVEWEAMSEPGQNHFVIRLNGDVEEIEPD